MDSRTALGTRWTAIIVAVAMMIVLTGQGSALAAVGDLRVGQTIAHNVPGAVEIGPDNPIYTARGVAVSPDESSVYVVSNGGNDYAGSISHFRRAADGSLSFAGCLGPMPPCRYLDGGLISGAYQVVVGNGVVFVVTVYYVLTFFRTSAGDLAYASCVSGLPSTRCVYYSNLSDIMRGIAVSPDSRDVYVLAPRFGTGSVVQLRYDPRTGTLGYVGCIGDNYPGCQPTVARNILHDPYGSVMSSDGRSLYVASTLPGVITHFRRDPVTGNLREAGCIGYVGGLDSGLSGCTTIDVDLFSSQIDLTKVGDSLYLAGTQAVGHMRRDVNTGDLRYAGCIGHVNGCTVAGPTVAYTNVVTSSDGRSIYLTAQPDGVVHYRRADNGDLSYAGCIGETDPTWCTQTGLHGPLAYGLRGIALAVSPSGRSLYAVNYNGAITHLLRQLS